MFLPLVRRVGCPGRKERCRGRKEANVACVEACTLHAFSIGYMTRQVRGVHMCVCVFT